MVPAHVPITAGEPIRTLDGGWFGLTECLHAPGQVVDAHAHPNPDLTIVCSGAYETGRHSRRHYCTPGTALFLPGGFEHNDRFGTRVTRSVIIEFRRPRWERFGRRTSPPSEATRLAGFTIQRLARRLEKTLTFGEMSDAEDVVVELVGCLVRCDDAISTGRRPHWLKEAYEEIRETFENGVSLSTLAERAHCHPVHFARAFRSHVGCSVGQLVHRLRIEAACEALATSDDSATRIATTVGFYDQAQFSRVFRRYVGMSPSEFRRTAASDKI